MYHGRTLTSKVSVRDTCSAIMKYAFVASPYPIIISAEIHCSVPQQEQLVIIMKEVFGEHLVWAPVDARPKIDVLPSPEELRGRVLLKAKNLYVSEKQGLAGTIGVADSDLGTEEHGGGRWVSKYSLGCDRYEAIQLTFARACEAETTTESRRRAARRDLGRRRWLAAARLCFLRAPTLSVGCTSTYGECRVSRAHTGGVGCPGRGRVPSRTQDGSKQFIRSVHVRLCGILLLIPTLLADTRRMSTPAYKMSAPLCCPQDPWGVRPLEPRPLRRVAGSREGEQSMRADLTTESAALQEYVLGAAAAIARLIISGQGRGGRLFTASVSNVPRCALLASPHAWRYVAVPPQPTYSERRKSCRDRKLCFKVRFSVNSKDDADDVPHLQTSSMPM